MTTAPNSPYIAIVDDDAAIRTSLGRALRMENYDVELFDDGASALRAVQLRAPDAIVLDLQLPDIDGLEICRRIRRSGDTTPILMLTARDAVNDRVEGLDAARRAKDLAGLGVERQIFKAQHRAVTVTGTVATQQGAQAREQLG